MSVRKYTKSCIQKDSYSSNGCVSSIQTGLLSIHYFHTNISYNTSVERREFECFFVIEDAVVIDSIDLIVVIDSIDSNRFDRCDDFDRDDRRHCRRRCFW